MARERPPRLIVWDLLGEWGADVNTAAEPVAIQKLFAAVEPVRSLSELVRLTKNKRFRVAFRPATVPPPAWAKKKNALQQYRAAQFDFVCRLALNLGSLTYIVEELAFITSPSWSPPAWSGVTLTGRHAGLRVIGTSQRPAQIDKNFLGSCTAIHCGRLIYPDDIKAVAAPMQVPIERLRQLKPLEWIEADLSKGTHAETVLTF